MAEKVETTFFKFTHMQSMSIFLSCAQPCMASCGFYVFLLCSSILLKCYYDQIIDIHFLHFRVQYDFLTYLAKFQSITKIRSHSFFTFISENLWPPLLDLVPRLGCELEKMTSYAQKYLSIISTREVFLRI